MLFMTPIDLGKLELKNPRIHVLASAPGSPVTGQLYYDSAVNKLYCWNGTTWVDTTGAPVVDATTGVKGIVQLAGDLAGTAALPVVGPLKIDDGKVATANKDGLANVPSMRTLGTSALQAASGTDTRFTDSRAPNGSAGGDLTGSYPNPTINTAKIDDTHVKAANKDGIAGLASMRTLGGGATQAAAGNDTRFTDSRAPNGSASGDLTGSYPGPTVTAGAITDAKVNALNKDGLAATASMRTLGAGSTQAMPGNRTLDAIAAPTASVAMNGQAITGLPATSPVNPTDAASKAYVDASAQGLEVKQSVRFASTGNVTLPPGGASWSPDGFVVVNGDRILLKDQSTGSQNGLYVVAGVGTSVTLARSGDADTSAEVTSGLFVFVEEGTINADSGWVLTTNNPIVLATTALSFAQFSASGSILAGNGLVKNGNVLDVNVDGTATGGLELNADLIRVKALGIVNSMIAAGTIDLTAKVTGALPLANGGTGQTAAKAARETGLGAAGYYSSATHSSGTTITITQATHGLRATRGLIVQVREEATGSEVIVDSTVAANGDVVVTFAASQSANTYRVTIIG